MNRPSNRTIQWLLSGFAAVALLAAVGIWLLPRNTTEVTLSDGSTLRWLGVTEGTNALLVGSWLEKHFTRFIPAQGVQFGKYSINPPRRFHVRDADAPLVAWLELDGKSVGQEDFSFYFHGSRVIAANRSGRTFENPPPHVFYNSSNRVVLFIPLRAFPRDEKTVQLRFSPPHSAGEPGEWTELTFRNPLPQRKANWAAEALPAVSQHNEFNFQLTDVQRNPTRLIFVPPSTRWHLTSCRISDAEGNTRHLDSIRLSEGKIITLFSYSLETNKPWRVTATFIGASIEATLGSGSDAYIAEEVISIFLPHAGAVSNYISAKGEEYIFSFNGTELSARKIKGRPQPRLVLLGATNELGRRVRFGNYEQDWSSKLPTQTWRIESRSSELAVQFAEPKVVQADFVIQPD